MPPAKMHLMDRDAWESNVRNLGYRLPLTPDIGSDHALYLLDRLFRKNLARDENKKFFEIGCAPGGWLVYFNQAFGYQVSGIEITKTGAELARRNLELFGIDGEIMLGDILETRPEDDSFDVVFSVGLIEHFKNPKKLLQIHYDMLKDGGILIVGVPNLSIMNRFLQGALDRRALDGQNPDITRLPDFRRSFRDYPFDVIHMGCFGVFSLAPFTPLIRNKRVRDYLRGTVNPAVCRTLSRFPLPENRLTSPLLLFMGRKRIV